MMCPTNTAALIPLSLACRRRHARERGIDAAVLVGCITHSRSSFFFVPTAFSFRSCSAAQQASKPSSCLTTMPSDPTRTTRSGRILKKTSKSSLTTRSPTTSSPATSRSRHRDSSSNQNPRSKRTNLPNMSSPRLDAAKAAALRKRITKEEERIQRVLDNKAEVEEDLEGTYITLVERRKELEANASKYNYSRTSSRSHRRRSASSISSSSNKQRSSFKEVGHSYSKTLTSSIHHRFPAVAKTYIDNIFCYKFDARNLL